MAGFSSGLLDADDVGVGRFDRGGRVLEVGLATVDPTAVDVEAHHGELGLIVALVRIAGAAGAKPENQRRQNGSYRADRIPIPPHHHAPPRFQEHMVPYGFRSRHGLFVGLPGLFGLEYRPSQDGAGHDSDQSRLRSLQLLQA